MTYSRFRAAVLVTLVLSTAAALSSPGDRPESQQEYWAQFERRDWTAAIEAAAALVTAARETAAQQPLDLANALSLLGNAQFGAGDYVSAEASYREALLLVEKHDGAISANLLNPLRGLGYTLAASGRHKEATPLLESALIVAHRNYGLFDTGQQGLLRQLATSLTKLGRADEAERHMNYMLRVAEQAYGQNDSRLVPTLCVIGEWYSDTGNLVPARDSYRNALEIVSRKLGKSHLAAVEPLRGLARTYTQELLYSSLGIQTVRERIPADADGTSNERKTMNPRHLDSEGEKALERALKIIEAQDEPPLETHIGTLVQLGDWRQIKQQPERALPFYVRAASLLPGAGAAQTDAPPANTGERPALLSFPVRLYYPMPWLAARNLSLPAESVDETFVELEFTVTRDGEVMDARVVESNGTDRHTANALEAIRAARYRPRFVNGKPVDTPGVTHREVFRTRKKPQDES